MMRELGETIGNTVVESVGRAVGRTQEQRPLPADILESEDAYLVVFDAPGVEGPDVQVRFEDGVVVRLDRFREFYEGYEMRFPGRGLSLEGSVRLPDGAAVDPSGASATLTQNGALQVCLPKAGPAGNADQASPEAGEEGHSEDEASAEGGDAGGTNGEDE